MTPLIVWASLIASLTLHLDSTRGFGAEAELHVSANSTQEQSLASWTASIAFALNDGSSSARRQAMSEIDTVARNIDQSSTGYLPPSASLRAALCHLLNSSDSYERARAVSALSVFWNPVPVAVRECMTQRFSIEQSPIVRSLIVHNLGRRAHQEPFDARQILIAGLEDVSPSVRRSAAMASATFRVAETLPLLVAELTRNDPETKAECIVGIASFGVEAASYTPLLETMLQAETATGLRQLLQRAIASLAQW